MTDSTAASAAQSLETALALHKGGNPAEAFLHYRAALERQPDRGELHLSLGLVLYQAGAPDDAPLSELRIPSRGTLTCG